MDLFACFLVWNPPASQAQIAAVVDEVGVELPRAYRQFLLEANGAECGPNDGPGDSLRIFDCSEVPSRGEDYGVHEYLPSMLCIASDGGPRAFAFDRSADVDPEGLPVVRFDWVAPFEDEVTFVADSFAAWAESGFSYEEEEVDFAPPPAQAAMQHRMLLRTATLDADAAYRAKEYGRLVELLAPFEEHLTDLQAARLAYARKKQQRD